MLKNPIVSTLFKSLLRWTRRPEVTGSRFALNANRFGIAKLLPHNVTVKNAEGVQAAVFHCFKTLPYTQDNINLGFSVLRELNATSAGLLDLTTARAARLKPENQAQAKFRIGQVVQHVDTNIRLVVTGWSIDETKACQLVEGIPDLLDTNEFAGFNNLNAVVKMYASELKLVDDKDLHRIINRSIQVFFEGYDSSRRRYTPSEEMRYWYAEDLVVLDRHAEMSQTATAPVPAAELKRLNSALHTVQGTIQSMGATMQAMVKAHQSRLDELALASPEMKTKMHDIIEEVERCIAGCIDLPPAMGKDDLPYRYGDGVTHAAPVQGPIFAQTLRRGGPHRHAVMTSASGTSGDAKEAEAHSSFGSKLIRMNAAEVKKVYTAVGYLGNLYSAVDQLLQLRFQAKGIAFHDGLHVLPAPISTGISASTNDAVTSRIAATPSLDARVEKWNAETTQPEATFQVGQVVRHRKFGYRGVIRGYDMRPSLDMSQWEGIVGLAQGQEQPIYRVIPDERDVQEMMGPHEFRAEYMVAQDNLALVTDRADKLVEHRELAKAFEGYDVASETFRVPHKLRYCFPVQAQEPKTPLAEVPSEWAQTEAMHAVVDEMLLELLSYLRTSMSFARTSDAAQRASQAPATTATSQEYPNSASPAVTTAVTPAPAGGPLAVSLQELLSMMKFAQTQEQAIYVESLMWLIWIAHTSPDINKLMRLSMSHAKRGNLKQAIEIVTLASELDPSYGEAYNKRASYHHFLLDYDACIVDAQRALDIFPEHVGALSGLGLCYEHKGDTENALKTVRAALDVHPYAAHLPTLLISMLTDTPRARGSRFRSTRTGGATARSTVRDD